MNQKSNGAARLDLATEGSCAHFITAGHAMLVTSTALEWDLPRSRLCGLIVAEQICQSREDCSRRHAENSRIYSFGKAVFAGRVCAMVEEHDRNSGPDQLQCFSPRVALHSYQLCIKDNGLNLLAYADCNRLIGCVCL